MNFRSNITSAALIGGLFLTQTLFAQGTRAARPDDAEGDVIAVSEGDVIATGDSGSAAAERTGLTLQISGHEFKVTGGTPGARCAVLLGYELQRLTLPGGAELLVKPVAIVSMGEFDADGDYRFIVGYDGKALAAIKYHFQGIAEDVESGAYITTDVQTLDFTDLNTDGDVKAVGEGDPSHTSITVPSMITETARRCYA